ncbi:hypothetical protein ABEW34_31485 [Paenibacillus algorifonticola]|uniref:hypothetical protein n=1 Tax=Paenibacillus algorifonticola TaxID=684063 RepID=UPI003D29893C
MSRIGLKLKLFIMMIMIAGLCTVLGTTGSKAYAEAAGIELKTEAGYQGSMKMDKRMPAHLTLTNRTNADLKGEVVISIITPYGGMTTDYVVPVELPKETPVELTVSLPGTQLGKDNNKIRFFEGASAEGKEVAFIGKAFLDSHGTSDYTFGVLASDPDTLNFMPSLNVRGYQISVMPLTREQLPNEASLLDYFDVLAINDVATSDWSEQQVAAITGWISKGGTLILSGGAGYSKTAKAFAAIAPVEPDGGTVSQPISPEMVNAGEAKSASTGDMTLSTGKLAAGATKLIGGETPIAVERKLGLGKVLYIAFDPALEPIASWSGSATLYANWLQSSLFPMQQGYMSGNNAYWGFQQIVDQFPSITPPNFGLLLVMFIIYMIIVAPVLYLVLRKADKREWSWWLIPLISIICAVAIFFFGAENKRFMSTHTVQTVQLSGQGDGVKTGAFSIFVPNGGEVAARFDEALPLTPYASGSSTGDLNLRSDSRVVSIEGQTTAEWKNVEYWSTRKAVFEKVPMQEQVGQFKVSYQNSNGQMEYKIKNDTLNDLNDVVVVMNGSSYSIGDLKQGEEGSAIISNNPNTNMGYFNYGSMIFPYQSGNQDTFSRQRTLVETYFNMNYSSSTIPMIYGPVIIGFSENEDPLFTVNNTKVKAANLTMWVQSLGEMEPDENGRLVVPAGFVNPVIIEKSVNRIENYGNSTFSIGQGELVLEYSFPEREQLIYDQLDIHLDPSQSGQNLKWLIWDEAQGKWIKVAAEMDDPSSYLIDGFKLRMKLIVNTDLETRMPQVAVEGEVAKHE